MEFQTLQHAHTYKRMLTYTKHAHNAYLKTQTSFELTGPGTVSADLRSTTSIEWVSSQLRSGQQTRGFGGLSGGHAAGAPTAGITAAHFDRQTFCKVSALFEGALLRQGRIGC